MGVLVGLLLGLGLMLLLSTGSRRDDHAKVPAQVRLRELLAQAGVEGVAPSQVVALSFTLFVLVFVLVAGISQVPVIGLAFGLFAGAAPVVAIRGRRRRRDRELREAWPEAVDHLTSGIRAGLALPEAVAGLAERGPEVLRPAFAQFAVDYRASGRFAESLDRLKDGLADPVGDRVVEALRLAREVGGSELGHLLRTLAAFLREESRTRAELETRQGWTVNAARLALAAPWLLLLLLSTRPAAVAAYRTGTGALVLLIGGVVSLVAYRVMLQIARLPREQRVMR
jgi:tight adherence protein B